MKFYHYSKERYDVIKSKTAQTGVIPDDPRDYANHISLFTEPPPP